MSRLSMSLLFAMAIVIVLLLTGCPPEQEQVAGTAEEATTIPVTITNESLELGDTQVPAGNVTLSIKNNASQARTVTVIGPEKSRQTVRVQPGTTSTLLLTNAGAGTYRVISINLQNQREMVKSFIVTEPE